MIVTIMTIEDLQRMWLSVSSSSRKRWHRSNYGRDKSGNANWLFFRAIQEECFKSHGGTHFHQTVSELLSRHFCWNRVAWCVCQSQKHSIVYRWQVTPTYLFIYLLFNQLFFFLFVLLLSLLASLPIVYYNYLIIQPSRYVQTSTNHCLFRYCLLLN